ncbi:MAG: hypothetical protein ACK4JF_08640 [Methylohalobius sp.]
METHQADLPQQIQASPEVMIHVRFNYDGKVSEIGARPAGVPAQEWYDFLRRHVSCFEALSGGRGLFRLTQAEVAALQAACLEGRSP